MKAWSEAELDILRTVHARCGDAYEVQRLLPTTRTIRSVIERGRRMRIFFSLLPGQQHRPYKQAAQVGRFPRTDPCLRCKKNFRRMAIGHRLCQECRQLSEDTFTTPHRVLR